MNEKRKIQDTEIPHWVYEIDEEMKRVLNINDKPKPKCAETSAGGNNE